jgi:uncharacterized membrane protein
MDFKGYRRIQMIIAAVLAAMVSVFVIQGNFIIPIIAVIAAAGLILVVRKKVKEVTVDERDIKIAGLAGRMTYSVSAISLAVIGMVFFALGRNNAVYLVIGNTLAYVTCGIMLLYIVFTWYYSR